MQTLYIVSAVVSGVLIILSLVGADHDHDHDFGGGGDSDHETAGGTWIPFFSLRFYTYFFAAFGLTGLLLTYFTDASSALTAWIAGGVGLASGLLVAIFIRLLRVSEASGGATDKDVLGKEGQVLVAIRGSSPGRIRCSVKGDIIDFFAVSEDQRTLEPGESVVVVSMDNGRAQVMPTEAIFAEAAIERSHT